ncbi:hypothetical protein T265_00855 [Opisthorchis viverrini]|uniref:Uncharacterized protein n=1 Tax=Opisthorchis viverrini TaxID=6198 RepID=A0A075A0G2_OPIVI|nr:hypothetical protein T265_00855 [Opisthorchis viverrini]KER33153.1 hypothetical protein T265_00855 [Opisthorchis viverrini]
MSSCDKSLRQLGLELTTGPMGKTTKAGWGPTTPIRPKCYQFEQQTTIPIAGEIPTQTCPPSHYEDSTTLPPDCLVARLLVVRGLAVLGLAAPLWPSWHDCTLWNEVPTSVTRGIVAALKPDHHVKVAALEDSSDTDCLYRLVSVATTHVLTRPRTRKRTYIWGNRTQSAHTDSRARREQEFNRSPQVHGQLWNPCSSRTAEKNTVPPSGLSPRNPHIVLTDSITSEFNNGASIPYNHNLFEGIIVKERIHIDEEGNVKCLHLQLLIQAIWIATDNKQKLKPTSAHIMQRLQPCTGGFTRTPS